MYQITASQHDTLNDNVACVLKKSNSAKPTRQRPGNSESKIVAEGLITELEFAFSYVAQKTYVCLTTAIDR